MKDIKKARKEKNKRSVLRRQSIDTNDEGPMLETLYHTIRIGSTPTFLYFKEKNRQVSRCCARIIF